MDMDNVVKFGPEMINNGLFSYDVCIHHNPCNDGLAAAWVAKLFNPEINLIGQSPGCPTLLSAVQREDLSDKHIVFVDIAPTLDVLNELIKMCKSILILDHHKTNMDMMYKLTTLDVDNTDYRSLSVIFDMNRSGCQISWDYFNIKYKWYNMRPWFIDYIGDQDLYTWSLVNSREINKGLQEAGHINSIQSLQNLWDTTGNVYNLAHDDAKKSIIKYQLIPIGEMVNSRNRETINSLCKRASLLQYTAPDGVIYTAWYVNNTDYKVTSDLGHTLLDKVIYSGEYSDYADGSLPDFSIICRGYDCETGVLYFSLRGSEDRVDVSEIAKSIDANGRGGGHRGAAGCMVSIETFNRIFKTITRHNL